MVFKIRYFMNRVFSRIAILLFEINNLRLMLSKFLWMQLKDCEPLAKSLWQESKIVPYLSCITGEFVYIFIIVLDSIVTGDQFCFHMSRMFIISLDSSKRLSAHQLCILQVLNRSEFCLVTITISIGNILYQFKAYIYAHL